MESDLEKAVFLQAKSRGLKLTQEVMQYLLTHYSRDLKSLIPLLESINQASLREHRKVTIPFIKQVCPL
jgi:DnaA family protein